MFFKELRAESQLLLSCASAPVLPQNEQRIQGLLSAPLDWDLVLHSAATHNLTPLLFWNLQQANSEISPEIRQRLHVAFNANAARNFFLTAQLLEITAGFEAQGIVSLAYKGPALGMVAYGNILLRPFCDLDLLLHPEDIARAGVLLAQKGFVQNTHAGEARNDYAQQWTRAKSDAIESEVVVELHWNIAARHLALPLKLKRLWDAPMAVEISDSRVLAPARDDLFLLLAWHGYKHRWAVLEWLAAFSALACQNETGDWPRLLEKASQSGSRRVLLLALSLSRELFQTPLPEIAQEYLANDKAVHRLSRLILNSFFAEQSTLESAKKMDWYHLRSRERWRDKARYCWGLAHTPGQIDWRQGRFSSGEKLKRP